MERVKSIFKLEPRRKRVFSTVVGHGGSIMALYLSPFCLSFKKNFWSLTRGLNSIVSGKREAARSSMFSMLDRLASSIIVHKIEWPYSLSNRSPLCSHSMVDRMLRPFLSLNSINDICSVTVGCAAKRALVLSSIANCPSIE